MKPPLTRFCPTPTGEGGMHLGHLWMAFLNWAHGREDGIVLRFEDYLAREKNQTPVAALEECMQDFRVGLARFSIPVVCEILQSERLDAYADANETLFNSALSWHCDYDDADNRQAYSGPDIGFPGFSPTMCELSRVVDDHDYGVGYVIRGLDLACSFAAYRVLWQVCYPGEPRPAQWFVPFVYETEAPWRLGQREKISKSKSKGFFLNEFDFDPLRTLKELAMRQMRITKFSGAFPKDGSLEELRRWVGLASINLDPDPITIEEVTTWN